MGNKNRFGLSRAIPNAVKKQVRRRCGFGCVICGSAIYTYEHVEPKFSEAKLHDPRGITLLCGAHQLESSKGLLSVDAIRQGDADPASIKSGAANHLLDIGKGRPVLLIGGNDFSRCGPNVAFNGSLLLEVRPPEKFSPYWRLNGSFCDNQGKLLCRIEDNEIFIAADNIDFEQTGTKFSISTAKEKGFFEIESRPPNGLALNKFTLRASDGILKVRKTERGSILEIDRHQPAAGSGSELQTKSGGGGMIFENCAFDSSSGINFVVTEHQVSFGAY